MYLKYSLGFLIASLVQAGTVALAEFLNISSLGIGMTFSQLLIHAIVGQIAGYVLLFAVRKVDFIKNIGAGTLGIVWGVIAWAIIVPIAVSQGKLNAPWAQNIGTLLATISAFILYGLISSYTVKRYGYEEVEKV